MDAPQLVLLAVGALLVTGGLSGILLLDSEGPDVLYTFTFTARTEDLPLSDPAWSTATSDIAFRVTRLNVTRVEVEVACTDPNPTATVNPATVTAGLRGPSGFTGTANAACGQPLVVFSTTGSVPATTQGNGNSPENAIERLPPSFTLANATGDWTVSVTSARSQGTPVGGQPSGSVAVTITSYVTSAELTPLR